MEPYPPGRLEDNPLPEYVFEDTSTGERVTMVYAMKDVPSIGSIVTKPDATYRRVADNQFQVDTGVLRYKYPYVSQSLPRNLEGCKTNKQGKPIIESRRHEANVAARHGYERDY